MDQTQSIFTEPKTGQNWVPILIGIIVLVILILLYTSEKFALPMPQAITGVYTAGASLRQQSIDSASNRGFTDLQDNSNAMY